MFEPERLLLVLAKHDVDFVVIGGIAATLHGSRRITTDVDVLFERSRGNRERLAVALTALNARLWTAEDTSPGAAPRRLRAWQVEARVALQRIDADTLGLWDMYHFVTSFGEVDCMTTAPGSPPYAEARERAGEARFEAATICVIGLNDLIAMKRAAGRPKDLETVGELLEIRRLLAEERPPMPESQQDPDAGDC